MTVNAPPGGRLWIFALAAFAVGALLALRWYSLQVESFDRYWQEAQDNQFKTLPVEPPRGRIFDRKGEPLAVNRTVYSLKVGSDFAGEVLGKIDVLKKTVKIPEDAVKQLAKSKDSKIYDIITLRENLTEEEAVRFLGRQFLFPEIVLESELAREYPLGDSAGHVVGHVGRISEKDMESLKSQGLEKHYRGAKFTGKTGVELIYEKALRGESGLQEAQVDAHGRIYGRRIRRSPRPGDDIELSLDMRLQRLAESLLAGESGAAVLMDVENGELFVLASSPRFDVNNFVFGISRPNWDALNTSPQKPLIHRAIYGQYAPGSTIKPFFALAALKHGWRDKKYIYHSRGYFQLGTHRFSDWKEGGHGRVNIARSIVRSVNSFYYELGHEIGVESMHEGLSVFGLGKKSGIDLDGEKGGVLPNTEWKKKQYNQEWFPGDTISASVGQGYVLATPLQMAAAMCMIANGGKRLRPQIRRSTGANARILDFSSEHLALVRGALAAVTKPGGTAPRVGRGIKYGIAGKTGTAQVSRLRRDESGGRIKNEDLPKHLRDDAWFVGYAPANNPRVAVAVIVENSGSGGRVAGPIARDLVAAYMEEYAPPYRPLPPHAEGA